VRLKRMTITRKTKMVGKTIWGEKGRDDIDTKAIKKK
jgi:hypothetical protein